MAEHSTNPAKLQRWIPLESNPEVMNNWAAKAGLVTSQDAFTDIYGLDPDLLAMIPQPVKAVVLLFPLTSEVKKIRDEEDKISSPSAVDPTIIWMKQTISNACGTMGMLHALMNSNVTVTPESPLEKFIDLCKDKTPLQRAHLLETTPLFASIHAESATAGQSAIPSNLDTDFHFLSFVLAPDASPETGPGHRLIELDGERSGPLDRGPCEDLLSGVAEVVKEKFIANSDSLEFNLIALAPPID